jgi:hypothetical protein
LFLESTTPAINPHDARHNSRHSFGTQDAIEAGLLAVTPLGVVLLHHDRLRLQV